MRVCKLSITAAFGPANGTTPGSGSGSGSGSMVVGQSPSLDAARVASQMRGGLKLVNNTNLERLSAPQKAELFRLKGSFLAGLSREPEAEEAYSQAAQLSGDYGKNWYTWGEYCEELMARDHKVQYGLQAMACYAQALQHKYSGAAAHLAVPRMLWMLTSDDGEQTLAKAMETLGSQLPAAVWIPWLPQLTSSLMRAEASQMHALLDKVHECTRLHVVHGRTHKQKYARAQIHAQPHPCTNTPTHARAGIGPVPAGRLLLPPGAAAGTSRCARSNLFPCSDRTTHFMTSMSHCGLTNTVWRRAGTLW